MRYLTNSLLGGLLAALALTASAQSAPSSSSAPAASALSAPAAPAPAAPAALSTPTTPTTPAPAPAAAPYFATWPGAAPSDKLDGQRGGADTVSTQASLNATVANNSARNVVTGNNVIDNGSFANMSGLPMVIQNTGANVLIQNATVINLQMR